MSEYRDSLKGINKEAPYTAWTIFKWGLLAIIVIGALLFLAQSSGIISMNIEREVTQHSRQYVETKITLLEKLHSDWLQLDAEIAELERGGEENQEIVSAKRAQQKSIVARLQTEAHLIPSSQVPDSVQSFLTTHK